MAERYIEIIAGLNRIRNRGGVCINIADFGLELLNNGRLKYFPRSAWGASGGIGGPSFGNGENPFIALMEDYAKLYIHQTFSVSGITESGKTYSHTINFEWALIHEIEHAMGSLFHVEEDPWLTSNVQECSGRN